jgi:hypothetical protein
MYCEICCWYDADTYFDDSEYSTSKMIINGYNTVINLNGFNKLFVCNECLIQRIYVCDTELKRAVLNEIPYYIASKIIQKWWLKHLYCIDTNVGKKYIHKKLSKDTANFFKIQL